MEAGGRARVCLLLLVLAGLVLLPAVGRAQDATSLAAEAARTDHLAERLGEGESVRAIAAGFGSFLGADARAVVSGLRSGVPFEVPSSPAGAGVRAVRMASPVGGMDFGDIFVSLELARQRLARAGIGRPTPPEIRAALAGGAVRRAGREERLEGILELRRRGLGWAEVAGRLRLELGRAESGLKALNRSLAEGRASAAKGREAEREVAEPARITESGIVTGRGKTLPHYVQPAEGERGIGEGIVSGSGNILGVRGRPLPPSDPEDEAER